MGWGGDIIAIIFPTRRHHNKCPLTHSIISCSNTVSERRHRSGQNIFPPILTGLSTGANVAGTAKYLAASAARCVNTFACWEAQKVSESFCLSSTGCCRYSWSSSCTVGGGTGWEAVGFGACPGTLCPSWGFFGGGALLSSASADEVASLLDRHALLTSSAVNLSSSSSWVHFSLKRGSRDGARM